MKLTGHKTEAVYRRYAIVSEADLAAGVTRLAVLHESLTKGTSPSSRCGRSGLAAATLGTEDAVSLAQQPLDLVPEPGERLRSTFERERLDLVREGMQPARDNGASSLQLGTNLFGAAGHGPVPAVAISGRHKSICGRTARA